jgi:thiamine biosynthesis lipoprotein
MKASRRSFLAVGVGAFAVATVPFALWRKGTRAIRRRMPVMGTIAEIAVVGEGAQAAIDAALDRLRAVDVTMSRFRADSQIGIANARGVASISAETATVLTASLEWARRSEGAFDPCLGRVSELWNFSESSAPPTDYARFAGLHLYRHVDHDGSRVRITDASVGIDLGGIAKGHAVDLAVQALRDAGVTNAFVNVGGDLYAMGVSEDGDPWRVGVRDPDDPNGIIAEIEVADGAVATSGDYVRAFEHGGKRYHHLLDPRTAAPTATTRRSLTVTAPTCLDADAAATALFGRDGLPLPSGIRVAHAV